MTRIRLVVADDHRMFREALRLSLAAARDIVWAGEAATGAETLAVVERLQPDIVVLDIALPDMNGVEVARQLRLRSPQSRLLALSGYDERMFIEAMLSAGAQGYVVKSAGGDELIEAIRKVASGGQYFSGDAQHSLSQEKAAEAVLSPREQQVLRLLAGGLRSVQIGAELGITAATVEVHRRNIKEKLGLRSVVELTRYAIRAGLVSA